MRIKKIEPLVSNHTLRITTDDGKVGIFDVAPYLDLEAFTDLKDVNSFKSVNNGGYFVEWDCGADLSADTIEAHLS
jgi:hypothetical protein